MIALGPYPINPSVYSDKFSFHVPISAGPGSFVEFINLSLIDLQIRVDRGIFTVGARTQTCLALSDQLQGTQVFQVIPITQYLSTLSPQNITVNQGNGWLWVNVWQEGDGMQWYPPFALDAQVNWPQGSPIIANTFGTNSAVNLNVPTTPIPNTENVYLFGWDFTFDTPAANQAIILEINNLSFGVPLYRLNWTTGTTPQFFSRTFNPPLVSFPGQTPQFASTSAWNSDWTLNAYYLIGGI